LIHLSISITDGAMSSSGLKTAGHWRRAFGFAILRSETSKSKVKK